MSRMRRLKEFFKEHYVDIVGGLILTLGTALIMYIMYQYAINPGMEAIMK